MNHLSEEDLILVYYGELEAPSEAREHLRGCAVCAESAEALRRTLELCDALPVPEPDAAFTARVWAQVEPELRDNRPVRRWKLWVVPAFGFAAAIVALVLVYPVRREVPASALSDSARNRILAMSLADHLDRSQMLLTELENSDEVEPLRARAQDLVDESRLMRQWIAQGRQSGTLAVVEEVERVLTETANAGGGPEEMGALRAQIGSDSLLFKLKILEANLRTEGQRS